MRRATSAGPRGGGGAHPHDAVFARALAHPRPGAAAQLTEAKARSSARSSKEAATKSQERRGSSSKEPEEEPEEESQRRKQQHFVFSLIFGHF